MPFDSLFVGVTGLQSYQDQIDLISNNIANVGTTGYKGQRMTFQDLFYEQQRYASAPTQSSGGTDGQSVGMGVGVASTDTLFSQGGLQTTGVATDLAISGDGFFVLRAPNAASSPVYSRAGAFSLNANGLLYDPASGLAVQGYLADKNGAISQTGTPNDITIPVGLKSNAIGTGQNIGQKFGPANDQIFDVSLGGNLDQSQWIKQAQSVQTGAPNGGQAYTTSTTIYDSLGNPHLASITYTPDATGASAGTATIGTNPALGGGGNLIVSANGATNAANLSVTVNNTGSQVAITDGSTTVYGAPGATVTFNGTTIVLGSFGAGDAGASATIADTAGSTGLPSSVADAAGAPHAAASRWKVSVSFADGTTFDTISNPGATSGTPATVAAPTYAAASSGVLGYVYYDQNGQFINTSSLVGAQGQPAGSPLSGAAVHGLSNGTTLASGNQLNVRSWGIGGTDNAAAPLSPGAAPATGPIGLDFHLATSLSGNATASVIAQNGYPAGILSNLTVSPDGTINGAFTNGQNQVLGRVAIATFQNEDGLQRLGGSSFGQTVSSGLAELGTAGTGRYGSMIAGALEGSNVSIADEFTKMIAAQNAYQANSKSITTASEDMQTVISLIR